MLLICLLLCLASFNLEGSHSQAFSFFFLGTNVISVAEALRKNKHSFRIDRLLDKLAVL